mgnify:CR=1 FL=1
MLSLSVLLGCLFFSSIAGWICLRMGGARTQMDVFESFLYSVFMPVCLAAVLYVLFY